MFYSIFFGGGGKYFYGLRTTTNAFIYTMLIFV